tara:strand:- start:633 stop:917 length:285 start_codon:yes stop_codon:yes gene_type:complete
MKVSTLEEEIHVQGRLMVLGLKDAIKLSMLDAGEKVYLPDDRPQVDGEIFEVVVKEFYAPKPVSIADQYADAICGYNPNEIKQEPIEKRRYIII